MPQEFKLPALGENVESGDVVKILVSEGDRVQAQDTVLELETDKAVVEVPSSVSGVVRKINVKEGQSVNVGDVIFTVDADAEQPEPAPAEPQPEAAPEPPQAEARPEPEPRPEAQAPPEPEGQAEPEAKTPRKAAPAVADEEGQRVARRGEVVDFSRIQRPAVPAPAAEKPRQLAPAAPSVRRLAREIGVDINQVRGSGPRGRISGEDVKTFAREQLKGAVAAAPLVALPDFERWGEVSRERFSNVRRVTARHMAAGWAAVAHVTQHDKADITELEELRRRYAPRVEQQGGKLTVTAILVKVLAGALKNFPKFNASLDMQSEEVVYKKYYHIGVAVDTPRGLLVPVLRDVNEKNLIELSVELSQIAAQARDGRLTPEQMQGGTFTVTNLGGLGGTFFTPIVNLPEVAILGVSRSAVEPVYRNGQLEPRRILPLSLSYDHRLIDGADAVRFLRWVAEALETTFLMTLEG